MMRALVPALAILALSAPAVAAQESDTTSAAEVRSDGPAIDPSVVAPVPFGPGEDLRYDVSVGILGGGKGRMQVVGLDTIRGFPTYHVKLHMEGGVLFGAFSLKDTLQSWIDVQSLTARRFRQEQKETGYERYRQFEFYPEEKRFEKIRLEEPGSYEGAEVDEEGTLPTFLPLDDISFVYFVRTLPLEVGETYEFDRYFEEDGNPVVLKVLRKETVEVPAGRFETVVVRPIIKAGGLFGEGGEAEIYISDDDRRLVVQMKSKLPVVATLTMKLTAVQEGVPLAASAEPTYSRSRTDGGPGEGR